MLEIRPNCECCDQVLPPDSVAYICTFECTWCAECVATFPHRSCPNCGGNLQPRPIRPHHLLATHPASTRKIPAGGCRAREVRDEEYLMEHANHSPAELSASLDELAHAAAEAPDTWWTRAVLARAVRELETAADASLGDCEHEPLVMLQRRLGRVHGRLLVTVTPALGPGKIETYVDALGDHRVLSARSKPGERAEPTAPAAMNTCAVSPT